MDHGQDNRSHEVEILRERNNELARIACRLAEALEAGENLEWLILKDDKASKEAVEWYKEHKIADAKAKEQRRQAALAKKRATEKTELKKKVLARLTPEERDALGMK